MQRPTRAGRPAKTSWTTSVPSVVTSVSRVTRHCAGGGNGEARDPLGTPGFKGWQRPTLPRPLERSTIGATGLNYRVRNGNGCGPCALVASRMCWASRRRPYNRRIGWCAIRCEETGRDQTSRAISSARLKVSRPVHLRPINVVVSHGPSGGLSPRNVHLGKSFPLRCFQRLSRPDIATQRLPLA